MKESNPYEEAKKKFDKEHPNHLGIGVAPLIYAIEPDLFDMARAAVESMPDDHPDPKEYIGQKLVTELTEFLRVRDMMYSDLIRMTAQALTLMQLIGIEKMQAMANEQDTDPDAIIQRNLDNLAKQLAKATGNPVELVKLDNPKANSFDIKLKRSNQPSPGDMGGE
jgi:hypothetical protein